MEVLLLTMLSSAQTPPKVSVVLVINRLRATLTAVISCLANQRLKDFELIVVNNSPSKLVSKDLLRLPENQCRIIMVPEKKHLYELRNHGFSHCQGEYVAFVDDDDLWHPEFLEMSLKTFEVESCHWTSSQYFDVDVRRKRYSFRDIEKKLFVPKLLIFNSVGHSSVVVRRDAAMPYPPFAKRHDLALWIKYIKAGLVYAPITNPLFIRLRMKDGFTQGKGDSVFWLYRVALEEAGYNRFQAVLSTCASIIRHLIYRLLRRRIHTSTCREIICHGHSKKTKDFMEKILFPTVS